MGDPAFQAVNLPENTLAFEQVPRDRDAVYLLDFDGVVASGIEDAIYKLPEQPGESDFLKSLAKRYSLRIAEMDLRYQRHLLFQEAARRAGFPIEPGPGLGLAKWATEHSRAFILTARSGWSATFRVRQFIEQYLQPPIELYQLGRTSKKLQVSLLCQEFSAAPVFYVEDSPAHLVDASTLDYGNLQLAHCSKNFSQHQVIELYRKILLQDPPDGRD